MICKECKKKGLKSIVYPGVGQTTAMYFIPFYDEEGNYHDHDANTITTDYTCSNGHKWSKKTTGSCWCGWPGKEKDMNYHNNAGIIIVGECSDGNAEVGSMWLETQLFEEFRTLKEVLKWAEKRKINGRLRIDKLLPVIKFEKGAKQLKNKH